MITIEPKLFPYHVLVKVTREESAETRHYFIRCADKSRAVEIASQQIRMASDEQVKTQVTVMEADQLHQIDPYVGEQVFLL